MAGADTPGTAGSGSSGGWDGTGWQRFFFAGNWHEWHAWKVLGGANPYTWQDFFTSSIFYSLLVLGVLVIPPEIAREIPAAAAEVERRERKFISVCQSGDFSLERLLNLDKEVD